MRENEALLKLLATNTTEGPRDADDLLACLKALSMTAAVWQMEAIIERLAGMDELEADNGQMADTLTMQEEEIKDLEARIKDLEAELED